MGTQTAMGARMSRAWDGVRKALSNMDEDYADMARLDILQLLSSIRLACEKYPHKALQKDRGTVAPRHLVWVAVGLGTEEEDAEDYGTVILWSDRAMRIVLREDRKERGAG